MNFQYPTLKPTPFKKENRAEATSCTPSTLTKGHYIQEREREREKLSIIIIFIDTDYMRLPSHKTVEWVCLSEHAELLPHACNGSGSYPCMSRPVASGPTLTAGHHRNPCCSCGYSTCPCRR